MLAMLFYRWTRKFNCILVSHVAGNVVLIYMYTCCQLHVFKYVYIIIEVVLQL